MSRPEAARFAHWDFWVDTGGTFTDCLARDPAGRIHRAKVLSSSALRGSVLDHPDPLEIRVAPAWAGADGLVTGFRFRSLASPAAERRVVDFSAASGLLRLDGGVPPLSRGSTFELVSPEEAPLLAARIVVGAGASAALPPLRMRLATTRGTNALLERRGSEVALFVTAGFSDLLAIGTQQRPELFALEIRRPSPLHAGVWEVSERLAADGSILKPLDEESLRIASRSAVAAGCRYAVVALLHSYRNAVHERRAESILRQAGFDDVVASTHAASSINYLNRTETALVDAYLAPVLSGYLRRVADAIPDSGGIGEPLHVMTSAGGLVPPRAFRPKDSLLSGPAGGVVGAAAAGRSAGFERVIAFDMGGTSTDVARYDGDFDYVWRHSVGGVELLAPALAIESVAAGGGSICSFELGALAVGPGSAGASPGPACYGAGGPLTITDCNLLLGRLEADRFGIPISRGAARDAFERLLDRIAAATGDRPAPEPLLTGLVEIANERMADAIRAISLRKGLDPGEYALVAFGGAGAQHACGVARKLGMSTVVVPRDAGLLSAWGLGHARLERVAERQILRPLGDPAELDREIDELATAATAALLAEGVPREEIEVRRRIVSLRLSGQDSALSIDAGGDLPLEERFARSYEAMYGHHPGDRAIEVESVRVFASRMVVPVDDRSGTLSVGGETGSIRAWLGGRWREMPCLERSSLPPGDALRGPCLIVDPYSTTYLEDGWTAAADASGALVLRLEGAAGVSGARGAERHQPSTVQEQLFTSRFEAIVGEMGEQLRRTAISTNVKERLDFSCALLDASGRLVANAPHIPVHLGALGLCVRRVAGVVQMDPGTVVVTNHPAYGGSHLPDVTVITPVHDEGDSLVGYVASRAHHAEIGGSRPGSMPPDARTLVEEGVVVPPTVLVRGGRADWVSLARLLREAPFPSRAVRENLADIRGQVAANQRGAQLLGALAARHGTPTVRDQMRALTARSADLARVALRRLQAAVYEAKERLDDGSPLAVRVTIEGGEATIDFTGTAPAHPGNLNATPAIVRSVVLYVVRLLIDEPLPLNEGLLDPIEIVLPPSLLSPDFSGAAAAIPAVVGGNTEVSQRLVDTLLKAFGLAACSQGTMNNVLWGNDRFGYYETLGGGAGAGPGYAGASGVHTHMTNTRITDAEVLEHRYPVRIERYAIRHGSGGEGRWRGGDGIVREIRFLAPVSLSVLTQHRVELPFGLEGGGPGLPGRQRVLRADGVELPLGPIDGADLEPGDRLIIETPGGGGWGR